MTSGRTLHEGARAGRPLTILGACLLAYGALAAALGARTMAPRTDSAGSPAASHTQWRR